MKNLVRLILPAMIASQAFAIDIIPDPVSLKAGTGSFVFREASRVYTPVSFKQEASALVQLFKTSKGFELLTAQNANSADVVFKHAPELEQKLGNEGYQLKVTAGHIEITAAKGAGAFYAVQSIRQMLPVEVDGYYPVSDIKMSIPAVKIEDRPRFEWRGYMLDCSRYFLSVDRIKKHLDLMALYKINTFQWHLTDYQGWRMQVMKYPRLTKVGSLRHSTVTYLRGKKKYDDQTPHNGFYTQDQIREIVAYAQARHIRVIPEIDVPAHSLAAIAAYPELSCTGAQVDVKRSKSGGSSNVFCPGKEHTFEFIEDVLLEVFELFPSTIVHIGGDEVDKSGWEKCEHCQKRMKDQGIKGLDELQSYFIARVETFANKHGKTIIGWDEILDGGLAPNALVMSWRGTKGGIKAAQIGHHVVMTPNKDLYFDYVQTKKREEESFVTFKSVLPLGRVYNYEPIPTELSVEESKYILGAQANMWSNFVNSPAHFEYMTYPRLLALAELTWTPAQQKDYKRFSAKMEKEYARFDEMHIAYRRHDK